MAISKRYFIVVVVILGIHRKASLASKCDQSLGLDWYSPDDLKLPDDQLSASTEDPYTYARYGRLRHPRSVKVFGVWCASNTDTDPWFQVDHGQMKTVTKIAIGSNSFISAFVKSYSVKYSYNQISWLEILDSTNSKPKIFEGADNYYDVKIVSIGTAITARYFRIYPKTNEGNKFCMQLELYGCKPEQDCNSVIGVANPLVIPDKRFTASSFHKYHYPYDARLNKQAVIPYQWGAWCAAGSDNLPWLQIDLGYTRKLTALQTQGHPLQVMNAWTEQYRLNYSANAVQWHQYGANKTFMSNWDGNGSKMNILDHPVVARYVRLMPIVWHELPCLRVEVRDCCPQKESIPRVTNGLADVTIKRGESLHLSCEFRGQPGIILAWHMNGKFLPTDKRISTSFVEEQRTIQGKLSFQRVKSEDGDSTFTCLAWYPNLPNIYRKSEALVTVLAPVPVLNITHVTATTIGVALSFTGPLTQDVKGYAVRAQSKTDIFTVLVNFNETAYRNITKMIHPYISYKLSAAMFYIKEEIGRFYSTKELQTLQDKPYGSPLNLHVVKITHNSLNCTWHLPLATLQNGPITHYELRYVKSMVKNEPAITKTTLVSRRQKTLYNLEPGSNYEISVRAFTKVGGGPFVHPPFMIFTGKATEELIELNKVVINTGNAAGVGKRLSNITANPNFLNKHDVVLTLDILEKVVHIENGSRLIGESLVTAVSNILKANKTVLEESEITNKTGTRYVKMLEKWLETVEPKDKFLQENSENIVVKKIFLQKLELEEGIKFKEASGEIMIPKEALGKNSSEESIYFVYYKKNKFFTKQRIVEEWCEDGFTLVKERIYTPVISGEIVGQETKNLSTPVVLKFKANEKVDLKESACVYWDFNVNNKKGDWSNEGCKVHSIANQTIICHCNHLTNFAAMMDVYAHTSRVCGIHRQVLTYISMIGCFLSIIGLFLTFLTYIVFRRLLKEMAAKVLVQLCGSMLVVVVTFVAGFEKVDNPTLCVCVAAILHYFTLVVFMWMLMEAVFMYYAFVRVWPPREGGDIYKTTAVAWGFPFVVVMVTFLTSMDSYGGNHYCHLMGVPMIVTYLAPIGIIIFANLIIFVSILYKLSVRPNSSTGKSSVSVGLVRLRRAFGIMILTGLTWGFGFGTVISEARLEFSYLFALFNALQGFAIFVFYALAQKDVRVAWQRFFTCDTRSELKRSTDSYYERKRMSSCASNKTNTLQFIRTSSNMSDVFRSNSTNHLLSNGSNQLIATNPVAAMNTIDEVDSPSPTKRRFEPLNNMNIILGSCDLEMKDVLDTAAEDELLDLKIQTEEAKKSKVDLNNYSSYRLLSGSTSYDAIGPLTSPPRSPLACKLRKQRRANSRNSLEDLRSSPGRKSVRPSKSVEPIASCLNRKNSAVSETTLTSDEQKTVIEELNNDTLKSDVATMTDVVCSPFNKPDNSQENIIRWLHDNEKDDSDYSSIYYRTSRSSSVADLASLARTNTDESKENCNAKQKSKEQLLFDHMVMGALKGSSANFLDPNSNNRDSLSSNEIDVFDEGGYSASDDEVLHSTSKQKLKKKKSRSHSHGLIKPPQYMTLEELGIHASYA